ncbi:phage antirepressor KilAC domain-containing protein [Microbacterium galbinum]|uniref:phage antirepressor KilAC domain-containing protein n=1 Tax=Microbacterium galbinum TaxID=2851646 RepID=UPI001FFCBCCC|nr:phage antirepressor KilAC domain-containing protein [Microbacterium galbinum]MCK2031233.1 phage antirepressor KilAC domain-containing protein [Microbacterium galbinum]
MSALEVFQYADREVRTVALDGEVWFVLADICGVLGIANPGNVAARLDEADIRQTDISSGGQRRTVSIVSESGMYEVAIRSDKPEAKQFRWWITHEVIPAIRRTGTYSVETPDQLMARAVLKAQEIIATRDQQIAELEPRAEAWDEIADAGSDYAVRDVAPMLNRAGIETGPQRLFDKLAELGWIYRGEKHRWTPYARAVDAGLLTVRAMPPHRDRDTGDLVPSAPQVRVTPKGIERLRIRLGAGVLTH